MTSREQLISVQKVFYTYCEKDKIISLAPEGLIETNFSKNSCFHIEKKFWPTFRPLVECDKPQETFYRDPKGLLRIIVQVLRSFL